MKKVSILIVAVFALASMVMAQTWAAGSSPISGTDVLGAHNNYGRGCAGCHAPHSGAFGAGGNGAGVTTTIDPYTGSNAIFAQNMYGLFGMTFNFGDSSNYSFTTDTSWDNAGYTIEQGAVRGILMCLACHDGAVAKGGMMTGTLYEATLPQLAATFGAKYGTDYANIPTWLGNDGTSMTGGDAYSNDHPVGFKANFGRLRLTSYFNVTFSATNSISSILPNGNAQYAAFIANYGYPAIAGNAWGWGFDASEDNPGVAGAAYITCTTCHNQHSMYIYKAPAGKQAGAAITANGSYPTFFFINSPYNITTQGATDGTTVASTTQFCRQCHFGEANEAFGVNNVTTEF